MKVSPEQWAELRQAVTDDDEPKFRAVVSQIVRQRIADHNAVVNHPRPCMPDGRPWIASCR